MNLRSMDLNLLLVFDTVYSERSISKAAVQLNLSQPAVSNALGRLRHTVDDPLFKREGNSMSPTPRAKSLREPIRQALELIERGMRSDESFRFAKSNREFVIAVEDYGEAVIIPRLIDWMANVAPDIRVTIRPEPSASIARELRDGTIDLALDYFALQGHGFVSKCVLTESLITLSRIAHPSLGETLTLDKFLEQRHVVITPRRRTQPMIDLALAKRGLERHIALMVPHFLSMPGMIQNSNLLGTLPRRMAFLYADHFQVRAHTVPIRTPDFPIYLIWHDTLNDDPGHRWLRGHLIALCENL